MQSELVLKVEDLNTNFYLREGIVRAVDGVDFELESGRVLGIVGESGCGKSVTGYSILRVIRPPGKITRGHIIYYGNRDKQIDIMNLQQNSEQIRAIRGKEISMIFQEPMTALSPVHSIGSQLAEGIQIHDKLSKKDAIDRSIEMLIKVGIPRSEHIINEYPFQLSGGMRQRVIIAMALMCNPKIIIADEPTTAIDVTLQAVILRLLNKLQQEMNLSIMFITHDLGVIAQISHKVAIMYLGKVVEYSSVNEIFDNPLHPYTKALINSIPNAAKKNGTEFIGIKGSVPNPFSIPSGCSFHPRCISMINGVCNKSDLPENKQIEADHWARCFLYE